MIALDMKIDLPHVTPRENKDGTFRYYFRRRGQPLKRIFGDPSSPEFMRAYQAQLNFVGEHIQASEGSFAWLCDQYMSSPAFKTKGEATRTARRRIILHMAAEPLVRGHPETFGMERAAKFTKAHIMALRDRKADKPNAANERIKILSQIFKLAIARGWRDDNPVQFVERFSVTTDGHRTATDDDIARYETFHTSGPARRAIVLLKAFGMRVSDLRIVGPQHVRNGRLIFTTVKTGVQCRLPMTDAVRAEVADCKQMAYMLNDWGRPFASDKALSQRISKWFRQAGVKGTTAHSVRKWVATRMADNGATEYELMAFFGWKDPKEARPYVNAANRERLADSASGKVQSVTSKS